MWKTHSHLADGLYFFYFLRQGLTVMQAGLELTNVQAGFRITALLLPLNCWAGGCGERHGRPPRPAGLFYYTHFTGGKKARAQGLCLPRSRARISTQVVPMLIHSGKSQNRAEAPSCFNAPKAATPGPSFPFPSWRCQHPSSMAASKSLTAVSCLG